MTDHRDQAQQVIADIIAGYIGGGAVHADGASDLAAAIVVAPGVEVVVDLLKVLRMEDFETQPMVIRNPIYPQHMRMTHWQLVIRLPMEPFPGPAQQDPGDE